MGQGAYIFGCEGARLGQDEAAFFRSADPFGFILFARNVVNPDQLRDLTSGLRDSVGRNAPILIDQEGGRVQRMTAPHWRQWLPPLDHVSASGDDAERSMWLRYRLIAEELHDVGIDVNCGPCADIASPQTHPFLQNRCYGEDAETVARIGRAVADGLMAGGVAPVLKHMPGHGRARVDSHTDLPQVTETAQDLFDTDFAPFIALNDIPMAMTAHIVFSGIDPHPATTSAEMIRLIRHGIGYHGLLMTDDISMEALDGDVAARSHAAINAGCDLILHCNGSLDEMRQVADVSGPMSDLAQHRATTALAARQHRSPIDIDAAEDELRALVNGAVYV